MTGATIAHAGRLPWWRTATLVLGVALFAAACGNPPSPTPSASPVASPSVAPSSAAPSPSATAAACAAADVHAAGGPWGGAAGSRGSDIVVSNQGSGPCLLPAGPAIALVDAGGAVLLSTPAKAGPGPSVPPGGSIGFSLLIGNWCAQDEHLPLHFRLALAGDAIDVGSLAVASADDLPPCNGPGLPPSLSATDWQP